MKNRAYSILIGTFFIAACTPSPIALDRVAEVIESACAGDTIIIADGHYTDLRLVWEADATAEKPIVVRAETAGNVIISGASNLRIAGRGLTVEGLRFEHGYSPEGPVIEFRNGDNLANECRVTNCAIIDYNPAKRQTLYDDVVMHGRDNRFDHNTLSGKLNLGLMLGVNLNNTESRPNRHRIDHNVFRNRHLFGSNGAETIRVGTSQQAYEQSLTVIEDNVFEHCNGEVEVVSIKSSDNIVRHNLFFDCQGVLALRHGDRNLAEQNIFIGNGVRNTGGIRIVNAGHKVKDNIFVGLQGGRFFSALALMDAVPNSLPNRYCQVEDVEITGNTFIDCSNIEFGTGRDEERTLAPRRILFADNAIRNLVLTAPFMAVDHTEGIEFRNNRADIGSKRLPAGFRKERIDVPNIELKTLYEGRGADWFIAENDNTDNRHETKTIDSAEALVDAVKTAEKGARIELAAGEYALEEGLVVSVPLTLCAAETAASKPIIRFAGRKKSNLVTIADGGSLVVEGIAFCGSLTAGRAGARHAITTAEGMLEPYELSVADCEFYDFGESTCRAIRGAQNTFADRIAVRRSIFRNLSGNAIDYAAEKEDIGRYNAEEITIEDCVFENMLGLGIDIYRGGSDESTAGPYVRIDGCLFIDVCNRGRGSAARLIGVQDLAVTDCTFRNSGRGGAAVRLDETPWEKIVIDGCRFIDSGRIISNTQIKNKQK